MSTVSVGDYCIHQDTFSREVLGPVEKVTERTLTVPARWGSKPSRVLRSSVLFTGPKDACQGLLEKLKSSQALCNKEIRESGDRHANRMKRLIAEAQS